MIVWNEAQTITETLELSQEVHQDLQRLLPNQILETMKSWIPGLTRLGYRLLMAALILAIGFHIARTVQKMLSLQRINWESVLPPLSRFWDPQVWRLVYLCRICWEILPEG